MNRHIELSCDVAVIGGGTGGLSAAIAAARTGAKVILVERSSALGGTAASGLGILGYIDRGGHKVLGGLAQEYIDRLIARGASYGSYPCPVHNSITAISPDEFKLMAAQICRDEEIEVLYNCELSKVKVENGRISQLSVYGKCTDIVITAKVYVDGTGDGDLAYLAGVPFNTGQDDTGINQPATLMFTITDFDIEELFQFLEKNPDEVGIKECYATGYNVPFFRRTPSHCLIGLDGLIKKARTAGDFDVPRNQFIYINTANPKLLAINTVRITDINCADIMDLSRALDEGYRQIDVLMRFMHKYIPGFERAVISQISPTLGVRETRHFKALRRVTKEDAYGYVVDNETVALCGYNVDIHSGTADHIDLYKLEKAFGLPFGCMVPVYIDNLVLSGRILDMDTTVFAAARVMGPLMAMGEAGGIAAAWCAKKGTCLRDVDIARLRETLIERGAILEVNG